LSKYSKEARERLWTEAARLARGGTPMAEVFSEAARVESEAGDAARRLATSLEEGKTLAESMAFHADRFALGDAEALAAAERTGRVPEALRLLADRATDDWRPGPVAGGVVFNFFLTLLASCAIIAFLLVLFVVLRNTLLEELDVTFPAFTEGAHILLGFELVLLLTVGGAMVVFQWMPDWLVRRLPWLGALQTRVSPLGGVLRFGLLSAWCDRMDLFGRLGLGTEEAVELSARAAGHPVMDRVAASVAEDMRAGASLATAMEARTFFPDALVWSVYAGEEIGTTEHVWEPAGSVYRDEAYARARVILALARVVLVVAVILAAIITVLGILLPFWELLSWF